MTTLLVDLISQTRIDFLDDTEGPPEAGNWSNLTITNALNQAQREIARRCLLISDYTSEICSLTLAADVVTGLYPQGLVLSSKILRVRYVLFPIVASASKTRELSRGSTEQLNALHGRWQWIGKTGRVESFVTDMQRGMLTFDRLRRLRECRGLRQLLGSGGFARIERNRRAGRQTRQEFLHVPPLRYS